MKESNFNTQPLPKCLAMISSRAIVGIDAMPVVVEVHLANGLPSFSTVGMPETAVKESKDRVRGAIINSGLSFRQSVSPSTLRQLIYQSQAETSTCPLPLVS